jgi:hypothetical protein
VGPFQPVGDYVDALMHASAQRDALTAARYRASSAPRLPGSVVALAALPACVAVCGVPSALEMDRRTVRPMRAKQSGRIAHPTFERVIEAGRYLEKKSA